MIYAAIFLCCLLVIVAFVRFLNLSSPPGIPLLYHSNSEFVKMLVSLCPILDIPYIPPLIWGRSGHLQTFVYGKLGRFQTPFPEGRRIPLKMKDGATSTFDVYQPHVAHETKGDYTLVVCPGIANSSESQYIRVFVSHCQDHGYRVAVLNHLGALTTVPLTSPRIFSYGDIDEYGAMVNYIKREYPASLLIGVGFSMGGNIVLKYCGVSKTNRSNLMAAVSVCQGYDAALAQPYLMQWEGLRRGYMWSMAENMKLLLHRHADTLFSPEALKTYQYPVDPEAIFAANSLSDLDETFTRRMKGFSSLPEFYQWASSRHVLNNIDDIPVLIINCEDDPLIPHELLDTPKIFTHHQSKSLFVLTKHGGHLGFFEGAVWSAKRVTWMERAIVQYADAITGLHHAGQL